MKYIMQLTPHLTDALQDMPNRPRVNVLLFVSIRLSLSSTPRLIII